MFSDFLIFQLYLIFFFENIRASPCDERKPVSLQLLERVIDTSRKGCNVPGCPLHFNTQANDNPSQHAGL